jgi:hypothetical protein
MGSVLTSPGKLHERDLLATKTPPVDADLAEVYRLTGIDLTKVPEFMTTVQLATLLGIPPDSLQQDRYEGHSQLPYVKIGRRVRYLRVDLARYLIENRHFPGRKGGNGAA